MLTLYLFSSLWSLILTDTRPIYRDLSVQPFFWFINPKFAKLHDITRYTANSICDSICTFHIKSPMRWTTCNPTNPRGSSYPLACPSSHIVHISLGCHSNPVDTRDRYIRVHSAYSGWIHANTWRKYANQFKYILCGGWPAEFLTVNKRPKRAKGKFCGSLRHRFWTSKTDTNTMQPDQSTINLSKHCKSAGAKASKLFILRMRCFNRWLTDKLMCVASS